MPKKSTLKLFISRKQLKGAKRIVLVIEGQPKKAKPPKEDERIWDAWKRTKEWKALKRAVAARPNSSLIVSIIDLEEYARFVEANHTKGVILNLNAALNICSVQLASPYLGDLKKALRKELPIRKIGPLKRSILQELLF